MNYNKKMLQNKAVVLALAILCCLLWGSAFPTIKIGYRMLEIGSEDVQSQILFAGIRFFGAGVLTILIGSILQRRVLYPKKESLGLVFKLSLFQTIIQYFFFYIGLANSSGVKSSIINGMSTFFAIILATLVRKQEKMTTNKLLGCVLGILGVVIINIKDGGLEGGFSLNGEMFILIAAVSYAISSVLLKEYSLRENPVTLSGYQFMIGGLVMIIAGILAGGEVYATNISELLLIIYMALISAVAYSIWGILLKYNPVSSVTIYGFTNPIFGAILSAILLNEWNNFSLRYFVALILVSMGIFIVNKGDYN